jgi:hypothetical protein
MEKYFLCINDLQHETRVIDTTQKTPHLSYKEHPLIAV